jgi:solute carrier family 25 phosphate transporter 23/24/25/41
MWDGSENKPQLFPTEDDDNPIEDDPHIPLKPARRKQDVSSELAPDGQQLQQSKSKKGLKLMDFVPHIGYFLAGGLSGITSRTATAPLDRLKVYLIAQTGTADDAVVAARKGKALAAAKHGARTLWLACKDLWAAGGMRSLFAGECRHFIN